MTKEDIIHLIKETASNNAGKPLGEKKFYDQTGVKKSDWHGKFWVRWSDAVKESGLEPNKFITEAEPIEILLETLARLIKNQGRFPSPAELKMAHNNDPSIPSYQVIRKRLGGKHDQAKKILDFCLSHNRYELTQKICNEVLSTAKVELPSKKTKEESLGKVYLMKSGKYYKIGKTSHLGQRHYSIGLKLPEKLKIIHEITTDDPSGIERYWHERFKEKRMEGEWFDLSVEDLKAFKRRKHFM